MGLSTNEEKHAPTLPKHRPNTTNNSRGGKTINRAERTGARGQKARPYVSANLPPLALPSPRTIRKPLEATFFCPRCYMTPLMKSDRSSSEARCKGHADSLFDLVAWRDRVLCWEKEKKRENKELFQRR